MNEYSFLFLSLDFDYLVSRDSATQIFTFYLQSTKEKEIDFHHYLCFLRVIAIYLYSKGKLKYEESNTTEGGKGDKENKKVSCTCLLLLFI